MLAVIMVVGGDSSIKVPLGIFLLLLLFSTFAYETARKRQIEGAIYFFVGSGYPLRFFLGVLTAAPQIWKSMSYVQLFFIIMALGAYGSYSSIIAWANEVAEHFSVTPTKDHFKSLKKNLAERYKKAEKHKIRGKTIPLREYGKLNDPWSVAYIFSLVILWLVKVMYLSDLSVKGIWMLETFALLFFIVTILAKYEWIVLLLSFGWLFTVTAGILALIEISTPLWYLFLCLIQIIFTTTYFVLRYSIQVPSYNPSKILGLFIKLIIGDDAWECFSQHNRDKK